MQGYSFTSSSSSRRVVCRMVARSGFDTMGARVPS